MAKAKVQEIKWLPDAEPHNYPAAESYLRLLFDQKLVAKLVQRLREFPVERFRAKDIFRASQLSLLGVSNSHVAKGQMKIQTGSGSAEGTQATKSNCCTVPTRPSSCRKTLLAEVLAWVSWASFL